MEGSEEVTSIIILEWQPLAMACVAAQVNLIGIRITTLACRLPNILLVYIYIITSTRSAPTRFIPRHPCTISSACMGVSPPASQVPLSRKKCKIHSSVVH